MEERIVELQTRPRQVLTTQNERLVATLGRSARDQIVALKEEVDRLAAAASGGRCIPDRKR